MTPHIHIVQYYETDKMGITHHSNYLRWMEEARIAYLEQLGYPFAKLEEMGIASPVLGVTCDYKKSTTFSDEVSIVVSVQEFKGVKLHLSYEMKNASGDVVCVGTTSHAFFNLEGRPLRMKQEYPDLYEVLLGELEK
jgi:acyl-CoA thioester hydrolase